MTRGYYEGDDGDGPDYNWEGLQAATLSRAVAGKRGQRLLRELAAELDAMPHKRLVAGSFQRTDGEVCTLGVLGRARGLDMSELNRIAKFIDEDDDGCEALGELNNKAAAAFDVAKTLVADIMWRNDLNRRSETPEQRWTRMRGWIAGEIAEGSWTATTRRMCTVTQKRWWLSWYHDKSLGAFELHTPWWISGASGSSDTICAAVLAPDEDAARQLVYGSYDTRPGVLAFRFVEERPDDWAPWNLAPGVEGKSRFQRADWMQWPDDTAAAHAPECGGSVTTIVEEATERLRNAIGEALMNLPVDNDDIERGYEQWKTEQLLAAVEKLGPACAAWLKAMRSSEAPKVQALMHKGGAA